MSYYGSPGVNDQGMAIALAFFVVHATLCCSNDIALALDGPCSQQHLPVCCSCRQQPRQPDLPPKPSSNAKLCFMQPSWMPLCIACITTTPLLTASVMTGRTCYFGKR
eukprot:GHRR01030302.1.p2 GENE.GHRR01030302.1~~GHRR01030302.1.p2  ORF type:complete len:108 (-),score=6.06 GHRR01030302.1:124-447(-)